MRIMILTAAVLVLSACGTISAQDYTDAKMQAAIAEARLQGQMDAEAAITRDAEAIQRAIELWLEQQGYVDGRRPHRPGGA